MNQTLKISHQTVQGNQRRVVGVIVLLIITILTHAKMWPPSWFLLDPDYTRSKVVERYLMYGGIEHRVKDMHLQFIRQLFVKTFTCYNVSFFL